MLVFKKAADPKKAEFEKDLRGCIAALKECKKARHFPLYAAEKGLPSALEVKKEADGRISEFYGKHNSDGLLILRVELADSRSSPGRVLAILSIFTGANLLVIHNYISLAFSNFCVFVAATILMAFTRPNEFFAQLLQRLRDIELEDEIEKVRKIGPEEAEKRLKMFKAWRGS